MLDSNAVKSLLKNDLSFFSSQIKIFIDELKAKNELQFNNNLVRKSIQENLIEIAESSLNSKAKRIRPLFCYWILRCFSSGEDYDSNLIKTTQVAICIEILHNASLIIDDIEDGSLERRQKIALHVQYGMPNALNAGSWMYFLALTSLPKELQAFVSEALLDCHAGQAIDLYSSEKTFFYEFFFSSSKERWDYYKKCVEFKTTRLILLSSQCLNFILRINKVDFQFIENLVRKYGFIYQLFDDIKNLFPEFSGNKINEDIKSGFRSAVSMEYLDILPDSEKMKIFEIFNSGNFFQYIINDPIFNNAIKNCYFKAESMLNETSFYIQNYLGKDHIYCQSILEIFQAPFREIRDNLFPKLNQNSFSLNQGLQDHGN